MKDPFSAKNTREKRPRTKSTWSWKIEPPKRPRSQTGSGKVETLQPSPPLGRFERGIGAVGIGGFLGIRLCYHTATRHQACVVVALFGFRFFLMFIRHVLSDQH